MSLDDVKQKLKKEADRVAAQVTASGSAFSLDFLSWNLLLDRLQNLHLFSLVLIFPIVVVALCGSSTTAAAGYKRYRLPALAPSSPKATILPTILSLLLIYVGAALVLLKTGDLATGANAACLTSCLMVSAWAVSLFQMGELSLAFLCLLGDIVALLYVCAQFAEEVHFSVHCVGVAVLYHVYLFVSTGKILYDNEMKDALASIGGLPPVLQKQFEGKGGGGGGGRKHVPSRLGKK